VVVVTGGDAMPPAPWSQTGGAVDLLPQDVGVTGVPRGFLDHVRHDPTKPNGHGTRDAKESVSVFGRTITEPSSHVKTYENKNSSKAGEF